jgi:hypothetical protein
VFSTSVEFNIILSLSTIIISLKRDLCCNFQETPNVIVSVLVDLFDGVVHVFSNIVSIIR